MKRLILSTGVLVFGLSAHAHNGVGTTTTIKIKQTTSTSSGSSGCHTCSAGRRTGGPGMMLPTRNPMRPPVLGGIRAPGPIPPGGMRRGPLVLPNLGGSYGRGGPGTPPGLGGPGFPPPGGPGMPPGGGFPPGLGGPGMPAGGPNGQIPVIPQYIPISGNGLLGNGLSPLGLGAGQCGMGMGGMGMGGCGMNSPWGSPFMNPMSMMNNPWMNQQPNYGANSVPPPPAPRPQPINNASNNDSNDFDDVELPPVRPHGPIDNGGDDTTDGDTDTKPGPITPQTVALPADLQKAYKLCAIKLNMEDCTPEINQGQSSTTIPNCSGQAAQLVALKCSSVGTIKASETSHGALLDFAKCMQTEDSNIQAKGFKDGQIVQDFINGGLIDNVTLQSHCSNGAPAPEQIAQPETTPAQKEDKITPAAPNAPSAEPAPASTPSQPAEGISERNPTIET